MQKQQTEAQPPRAAGADALHGSLAELLAEHHEPKRDWVDRMLWFGGIQRTSRFKGGASAGQGERTPGPGRDGPPGHRRQPLHDGRDAGSRRGAVALAGLLHACSLHRLLLGVIPGAHHSRNVLERPEVEIVIFDSSVAVGHAEAVYLSACAREVPEAGLAVPSARLRRRGGARGFARDELPATGTCGSMWRPRPRGRS